MEKLLGGGIYRSGNRVVEVTHYVEEFDAVWDCGEAVSTITGIHKLTGRLLSNVPRGLAVGSEIAVISADGLNGRFVLKTSDGEIRSQGPFEIEHQEDWSPAL